jgi:heme A synthase
MRQQLGRHFDVVIVIWVLALALGWSLVTLSRAPLSGDQWSAAPQTGAAWVVPTGNPAQ